MAKTDITAERVRELLNYDPETGIFTRKLITNGRCKLGEVVGTDNGKGHLKMMLDREAYFAHRIAWLYVYGSWPELIIDHINGIRNDNRIANLRQVTCSVNSQNIKKARITNKSGLLGAFKQPNGKWQSWISRKGERFHLGTFDSAIAAHEAYLIAKRKIHEGCTI